VQRILPPADRARGFGIMFTGSSLGAMLAAPIASGLYDIWGWRVAFLGTALIGLVWLPVWLFFTTRLGVRQQLDTIPKTDGIQRPRPPTTDVLTHPALLRGILAILAVAPLFGVALGWGAKYLDTTFRIKQEDVGGYLWLPPVAFDAAAIAFGHIASKRHARAAGAPPRALFAIGVLLGTTIFALQWMSTPWAGVILVGVSIAGGGIVYTLSTADMLARMPPESVSLAAGAMAAAQSLALVIINPIIGALVDHYGNYDAVGVLLAIWVVPGSIAWLVWRPPPMVAR
jgi:ACS family hexuronate transporter-like MFS transporter